MTDSLRGKNNVDLLIDDFYLLWKIKNVFSNPHTYDKYTELHIAFRKMRLFQYLSSKT
jgi:hypothetical protein